MHGKVFFSKFSFALNNVKQRENNLFLVDQNWKCVLISLFISIKLRNSVGCMDHPSMLRTFIPSSANEYAKLPSLSLF